MQLYGIETMVLCALVKTDRALLEGRLPEADHFLDHALRLYSRIGYHPAVESRLYSVNLFYSLCSPPLVKVT